jgi:hypothetical protein
MDQKPTPESLSQTQIKAKSTFARVAAMSGRFTVKVMHYLLKFTWFCIKVGWKFMTSLKLDFNKDFRRMHNMFWGRY